MANNFGISVTDINKEWIAKYRVEPEPIEKYDRSKAMKGNTNGARKIFVRKEVKKIAPPQDQSKINESKKVVKVCIEQETEPSPVYNLRYPQEMLITKKVQK